MERKEIIVPFEIPAQAITLPTGGATVLKAARFCPGDADPNPVGKQFCVTFPVETIRYEGVVHPVDPNAPDIRFEIGLPLEWNGKLIHQGGAGVDGYVNPCAMHLHGQLRGAGSALQQGYGVFGGDGGHDNGQNPSDCGWIRNRECFNNFAHQSLKKVKDAAVYLVEAVFGKQPDAIYFYGGSNGGRECMKAIQNYPNDYDGAVCFFPVLYWVQKVIKDAQADHLQRRLGPQAQFSPERLRRIRQIAMERFDGLDGVEDRVIADVSGAEQKWYEVAEVVRGETTPEQFQVLTALAESFTMPYPLAFGREPLPGYNVYTGAVLETPFALNQMMQRFPVLSMGDSLIVNAFGSGREEEAEHPDWASWEARVREVSAQMDANSADLNGFIQRGGKLLLVQGTVDPMVTANGTIQYYNKLVKQYGQEKADSFLRFYIAPGYGHGTDGTFLITADFIGALDRWVQKGQGPGTLVVEDESDALNHRTRPLYVYPGYPYYCGSGDVNCWKSFREGKLQ